MANTTTISKKSSSDSGKLWRERKNWVSQGPYHYTDIFAVKGKGALLWDADGKQYIDFAGGIGTLNVGHCHPKVVEAVRKQAGELTHTCYSVALYESYHKVCEKLCKAAPGKFSKKAALFNSGAEAVENAIKLARRYTKRPAVIAFENSFHGRTWMSMTLTGKEKPYKVGFGPFVPEVYHAPFPYSYRLPEGVAEKDASKYALSALNWIFETKATPDKVAAIIIEPILGEGGFVVPPADFLPALRKICTQHGIVLIADEIQTGFGRTGKMFACEHWGIEPDLMTVAKSIAGGLPLSGVVGRTEILDCVEPGGIGGTYGGNPISCEAALAVFDIFEKEKLVERGAKLGRLIEERFRQMAKKYSVVGESRGLGAMQALELVEPGTKKPLAAEKVKAILHECQDKGLILLKAGMYGNVLRTLVPLVATESEVKEGLDILEAALKGASNENSNHGKKN